jgi:hypothetical protein
MMTPHLRANTLRPYLALVIALIWSSAVWANGQAFFRAAGKNAKVDLVYFGTIKDRATTRPLDFVDVTISAKNVMMTFPFSNDAPGHYRSPDIGLAIKEVGENVDPKQIEIVVYVEGYKKATRSVPRNTEGIIAIDFLLDRDGSTVADNPSAGRLPAARSWRIPTLGLFVLILSAVAVRTSARRRSTND